MNENLLLAMLGGQRPQFSGNINALYQQMLAGSQPGSLYQQGMNAASAIPNQIMNAFGQANQLSSLNMQNIHAQNARIAQANAEAQAQIEAERIRQQGANERVRSLSPLLQGLFSGVGSGLGSVQTDYGAGVKTQQGSAAQPTQARDYRNTGFATRTRY